MTYIIVDLEATCCNAGTIPRDEMEIIEIGAVACDGSSLEAVTEFQEFIRPSKNPVLTEFCMQLTSISQQDVDVAEPAQVVISRFGEWFWKCEKPVFCSWGDYDKKQFQQDCDRIGIANPLPSDHTNIKRRFSKRQGIKRLLGMSKALLRANLDLQGTHHRAIDDVRNMLRLLPFIFGNERIS